MAEMKKAVYTVYAYRRCGHERHRYIVGVYQNKHSALAAANTEIGYLGITRDCEVIEYAGLRQNPGSVFHNLGANKK